MFLGWKNQYCENDYATKCNLQIECNPYPNTNGFFCTELEFFQNSYEDTKDPKQPKQS